MCFVATMGEFGRKWSVVVLVVDEVGVAGVNPKSHAPIAADPDRPMTRQCTFEWMQVPARHVHIGRHLRLIQLGQLPAQSRGVRRLNASLAAGVKKHPKALVSERLDHLTSV